MPDPYLDTISRLEPEIAMIDAGAYYASAAISLKRIADALTLLSKPQFVVASPFEAGEYDPTTDTAPSIQVLPKDPNLRIAEALEAINAKLGNSPKGGSFAVFGDNQ